MLHPLLQLLPKPRLELTHAEVLSTLAAAPRRITISQPTKERPAEIRQITNSTLPVIAPHSSAILNIFQEHSDCLEGFPWDGAMIFTDGSYSTGHSAVQKIFEHAPTESKSAGSVILIQPDGTHPPVAFYLADGQKVGIDSAPSAELLTIYAALVLRCHVGRALPIYTDSQTSLNQLLSPITSLSPRTAGYGVVLACLQMMEHTGGWLRKVAAHPERETPKVSRWNTLQWGNHIADRVASLGPGAALRGCPPGSRSTHIRATTIPFTTVMTSAESNAHIYWSVGGRHSRMTLSSVNTHLGRHSLQMYLQERVKYSESLGRFSDWINTSSALASRAWQLSRRSLTSRAFAMRIIWDKGYHGGNRSKGAAYTQAQKDCLERCTVCAGVDSANHWIRECPNPVMVHSREVCNKGIKTYIAGVALKKVAAALTKVHQLALEGVDGHRIWTANWPSKCQQALLPYLTAACTVISPLAMRKHMIALSQFHITAVTSMWIDKISHVIHPYIANRLTGDMSALAHLYHGPKRKAVTPRCPRIRRQSGIRPAIRTVSGRAARPPTPHRGSHLITEFFSQRLPIRQEEADTYEELDEQSPSRKHPRIGDG